MKYTVVHEGKDVVVDVRDAGADTYEITAFGRTFSVSAHEEADGSLTVREGTDVWRADKSDLVVLNPREAHRRDLDKGAGGGAGTFEIKSPMPGKIVGVAVAAGAEVKAGQGLVTVEAMKMENELRAPQVGVITEVLVQPGQAVTAGAVLLRGKGLS